MEMASFSKFVATNPSRYLAHNKYSDILLAPILAAESREDETFRYR
jgi:hypothetical protein